MSTAPVPGTVPSSARAMTSDYRPLSRRRKLLIVALAVATAFTVVSLLLDPPGGVHRQQLQRADRLLCTEGQTENCVGGKADVIMVPRAPSSATP